VWEKGKESWVLCFALEWKGKGKEWKLEKTGACNVRTDRTVLDGTE